MSRRIGDYELLGTLGAGAFGRTYRARRGGLLYAVKLLKPEAVRDEVDARRFERECRALQKIDSEFVVPYRDHGVIEHEGVATFYLVMGYVEGKDLSKHLAGRSFPIDEADLRSWSDQILQGLAAIHGERIVHRDLKPSNILVGTDGRVRILDFGVVKMLDYTTITHTGGMVGTPLFMSPEEMLGTEIDHRSDLYSFGVLLFHLLTGKYPLKGDNHLQHVRLVTQEPPRRPREFVPGISNRLENLVLALLEKQPYLRPASAEDVRVALTRTPFFIQHDVPRPPERPEGFERKLCFIRLLPNEKTVLDRAADEAPSG